MKTPLLKYTRKENDSSYLHQFSHSQAHRSLGLSYQVNNDIYATQYDYSGNAKFEIKLNYSFFLGEMAMHNIDNNGFLLLTTEYLNISTRKSHLEKITLDGKRIYLTSFDGIRCDTDKNMTIKIGIFESGQEEYCISQLCYDSFKPNYIEKFPFMEFEIKCFSKNLF